MKFKKAIFLSLILISSITLLTAQKTSVDDALNDKSKLSGLTVGSYFGFGYSNGWIIDFSPGVGYKVFDFMIAGGGIAYSYAESHDFFEFDDKIYTTNVGPRGFVQVRLFQGVYGVAEYQYLTYNRKYKNANGEEEIRPGITEKSQYDVFYLGGGYSSAFGEGFGFTTEIVFNLLYDRGAQQGVNTPYTFRVGAFYTF